MRTQLLDFYWLELAMLI
uniref:Uncharacterized protein n=1 Tax=Solanum lycopersicum TaxID=4081 RepID=A0A3Q7F0U5_SOLLC